MKIMIKLLLLALVGALVAPFILKGPDGRPLMAWQDVFNKSGSASIGGKAMVSPKSSSGLTTVYKWQDDEGNWHFSDRPIESQSHETLKFNPNANIIQSLAKKEEMDDNNADVKVTPVSASQAGPSLTTVPLTEVPALMEQAKQYQNLMDQRNKTLEQFNKSK